MIQRPILTFAYAVLFSLAAGAVRGKPPEASSLDLETFVTQSGAWDVSSTGLRQRSGSKFQQGLCTTELMYASRGGDAFKFLGTPIAECVVRSRLVDSRKRRRLGYRWYCCQAAFSCWRVVFPSQTTNRVL